MLVNKTSINSNKDITSNYFSQDLLSAILLIIFFLIILEFCSKLKDQWKIMLFIRYFPFSCTIDLKISFWMARKHLFKYWKPLIINTLFKLQILEQMVEFPRFNSNAQANCGCIVGWGVLPAIPPTPFFQILSILPFPVSSDPHPHCSFCILLLWLNGWSRHIWCATLLNDIMDPHMSSLGTLVPVLEGTSCVFMHQGVKFNEVWYIMWVLLVITHTHTHTHTHTQSYTAHSGASALTHPYKYKFTPSVMCSQQWSLLHWMNNSLISKIYFPQCLFFSKIIVD